MDLVVVTTLVVVKLAVADLVVAILVVEDLVAMILVVENPAQANPEVAILVMEEPAVDKMTIYNLVEVLASELPSGKESKAANSNLCRVKDPLPAMKIMMVSHYPLSVHYISLTIKQTMPTYLAGMGGSKRIGNLGQIFLPTASFLLPVVRCWLDQRVALT